MDLPALIHALSDPAAYPSPTDRVEVRQTHISAVFLAGRLVYKIKKPVAFGFLDFTTLDRREHFCQEEVRLNARLAPGVYRAVVPITWDDGRAHVEGTAGEVLEWAVKMDRLRDEDSLEAWLSRDDVNDELIARLGRRLAEFHQSAERSPRIAENARFEAVAALVRENLAEAASKCAGSVSSSVIDRVGVLGEELLTCQRDLIESRARRGVPCDTHGDLRLDHVYLLPKEGPDREIVIIDCIEFNERFRFADPVADVAFLVMDFKFHGRRELASALAASYFNAAGDVDGQALLPLYCAYRAIVRGKVEALKAGEGEVPEADRAAAMNRSRGYWMLALGELEQPQRRPCLVLVGGLPGTGKSSLARELAQRQNLLVIRSDVVRKELAKVPHDSPSASEFEHGIYTADWTERTYAECRRRAEELLLDGKRVLIDASFGLNRYRRAFFDMAERLCVPAALLICRADPRVVHQRLAQRRGDASDADWAIYEQAAQGWEPLRLAPRASVHDIQTGGTLETALDQATLIVDKMTR